MKEELKSVLITTELADVEIVSKQVKSAVAGDELVNQFIQYKLNRQLKRIEDENMSSVSERV